MQKKTANELLSYMIELLTTYLYELSDALEENPDDQFIYGEKTAYTECLEIIANWKGAKQKGLYYDVETLFPL